MKALGNVYITDQREEDISKSMNNPTRQCERTRDREYYDWHPEIFIEYSVSLTLHASKIVIQILYKMST